MGCCGHLANKEEEYFNNFWDSLRIRTLTSSEFINQIYSLRKQDSYKHLIKSENERKVLFSKFLTSDISTYNSISKSLFNEISSHNFFTENEFMCFSFSLLLLTEDFEFLNNKSCINTLKNFFRLFKFKNFVSTDINNYYYMDALDIYYISCFYINLVSLRCVKEISVLAENKNSFEGKFNRSFSYYFQSQLQIELIGDILTKADEFDSKWLGLLKKFQQIELLARNDSPCRMKLSSYNNFTITQGNNSKIPKPEEFNTGIIIENKIETNTNSHEVRFDLNNIAENNNNNNDAHNNCNNQVPLENISMDVLVNNKDIIYVNLELFITKVLSCIKNHKVVREKLVKSSRSSLKKLQ